LSSSIRKVSTFLSGSTIRNSSTLRPSLKFTGWFEHAGIYCTFDLGNCIFFIMHPPMQPSPGWHHPILSSSTCPQQPALSVLAQWRPGAKTCAMRATSMCDGIPTQLPLSSIYQESIDNFIKHHHKKLFDSQKKNISLQDGLNMQGFTVRLLLSGNCILIMIFRMYTLHHAFRPTLFKIVHQTIYDQSMCAMHATSMWDAIPTQLPLSWINQESIDNFIKKHHKKLFDSQKKTSVYRMVWTCRDLQYVCYKVEIVFYLWYLGCALFTTLFGQLYSKLSVCQF